MFYLMVVYIILGQQTTIDTTERRDDLLSDQLGLDGQSDEGC